MSRKFLVKATCFDKRGRVISIGFNSYTRTHPKQAKLAKIAGLEEKQTLHAEIAAIIKARGKPIHSIMVERYHRDGKPALAAPCPVCQLAIKMAGIKHVHHT
jgi:deoxycytidylate deaminase